MTVEKNKRPRGAPPPKRVVKLTEGSKKARLSSARLAAAQAIYQMAKNEQSAADVLKDFKENRIGFELDGDVLVPADYDLLSEIVGGFEKRRADIEPMIAGSLGEERAVSIEMLLRSILCAGIYELMAHVDTPAGIIINDYLNVTHAFYDQGGEAKIVHAALDKITKLVRL